MDSKTIEQCLLVHRHVFQRRFSNLKKRQQQQLPASDGLEHLARQVEASIAVVRQRQVTLDISFPQELPINAEREKIRELIEHYQVIILCGETGSGKSTQLPKICLSMGRGVFGRIGHTQPRRLAARSLATRISAPPMVGVPALLKCDSGPSSRTL